MTRRLTAILLSLVLLLSVFPAVAEEAAKEEAVNPPDYIQEILTEGNESYVYYTGVECVGGKLYAMSNDTRLFAYDEAQKTWSAMAKKETEPSYGNYLLMSDGEKLYTLNRETGEIIAYTLTGDTYEASQLVMLPWDNMTIKEQEYSYSRDIPDAQMLNGKLYLLVQNDEWFYDLFIYDFATKQMDKIVLSAEDGVRELVAYKDGLCMLTQNQLYFYNLTTGAMEAMLTLNGYSNYGLAVASDGSLYVRSGDEIWSNRDGSFAVCGYAEVGALNYGNNGATMLGQYTYAYGMGDTISLRDTAPGNKPEFVLRVSYAGASIPQNALKAFAKLYPNVPVVCDDSTWFSSTQEMADHMNGANPSDIYTSYMQYIKLDTLAKKEYIAPISLPEFEQQLEPKYLDALSYQGQLYAVPLYVDAYTYGVSVKALQKIGLTENDIPKTYGQFLDFIDNWQSQYAQEFPEMQLFEDMQYNDLKGELTQQILHSYELSCEAKGEDISFNSPMLQKVLDQLSKTDFYGFYDPDNEDATMGGSMVIGGYYDEETPSAVFTSYFPAMLDGGDTRYQLMPLSLDEDEKGYLSVSMAYAVLNPDCQHVEAAKTLLKCIAENLDPSIQIALMPGKNEPVENEYMVRELAIMQKKLDKLQATYDAADEAGKAEIADYLTEMKESLERSEKYRYMVTAEQIQAFRQRSELLVPEKGSVLQNSNEITALLARFRDGSLDAASFLRELNRKVQMMLLEDE